MTTALSSILRNAAAFDADALWLEAVQAAGKAGSGSRRGKESPSEKIKVLRDKLRGELVAFHDQLDVHPASGASEQAGNAARSWDVSVPLTLFPKRDQGFTRVECIVDFSTEDERSRRFRVRALFPEKRSVVMARAEMGGNLELKTQADLKLPLPLPIGTSMVEAKGIVYGKGQADFQYVAERMCVDSEIVNGTGARWRLDDIHSPQKVGAESHQLRVILEVEPGAGPINAVGYLNAYSDTKWLTSTVGGAWLDFAGRLKNFFKRGVPAESFAEWRNVIPN